MNTLQMITMCQNIYKDFLREGRPEIPYATDILNAIMHIYARTEIDHEEIKWLWIQFLKSGVLDVEAAITMARKRIEYEGRM